MGDFQGPTVYLPEGKAPFFLVKSSKKRVQTVRQTDAQVRAGGQKNRHHAPASGA